jgi:hypothetical protein
MAQAISAGQRVLARRADGKLIERRAVTGPVSGTDIEVVWVCSEAEYLAAAAEDRRADAVPWPATAVEPCA